jgi:nitroimidazol reductase NimA-like FMN-containing flavoprotein (pyridoxamine 5'-phosphate oxidase superfamily)
VIEIEDLTDDEAVELLETIGFGHLACCRNDKPYIVPVHFAFTGGKAYIYTTEGKKTEIINSNPNVCLQAEDVRSNSDWKSVIVEGTASRIDQGPQRDHAIQLISKMNPTFTPAVSIRWLDSWVRENVEVILCITPVHISGRRGVDRSAPPMSSHSPKGQPM